MTGFFKRAFIICSLLLFIVTGAKAQTGVSFVLNYEKPFGVMGDFYKPGMNYLLSYTRYEKGFIFDLGIGATQLNQRFQEYRFIDTANNYYAIAFGKYFSAQIALGITKELNMEKRLRPMVGAEVFGSIGEHFYVLNPGSGYRSSPVYEGRVGFSSKAGFSYRVSEALRLFFVSKLNLMMSPDARNPNPSPYDPNKGSFNLGYTNGIGFTYRFQSSEEDLP